ncbi:Bromo adjacent domain-containing 1 protein, partial [Stegodyphus mimosarum]
MSASKPSSRAAAVKRDGNFRYATRLLALEKGKRVNHPKETKETNALKACECLLKSDGWKGSKISQNSKFPVKKSTSNKCCAVKDKKKITSANHHEKVVIVSKRSSSVSVVKSCSLRKSVSVKKVSYSTSVVLSSDEDSDSEEELGDDDDVDNDKDYYSKKKRTILKHTTSKVKSSYRQPKKSERSARKAKAIKLLCEKLSSNNKRKDISPTRELRPRFPYSMLQEWPTARAHRMASLNALAKVHVLYENEGRTSGENLNDADENTLIDLLNEENSDDEDDVIIKKETKSSVNSTNKKNDKAKNSESDKVKIDKKNKNSIAENKIPKKSRKRKVPEVEIIDTRVCKRMASLNAQAILAASYLQEPKPKRISKKYEKCDSSSDTDEKELSLESKCLLEITETEKEDKIINLKDAKESCDKFKSETVADSAKEKKSIDKNLHTSDVSKTTTSETPYHSSWTVESDIAVSKSCQEEVIPHNVEKNNLVSSTASTKVGVTQYTEVRKVQINTRKDVEIKEESKSERKIERILSNDDVAITQMYRYQSKNASESYCVQMQTTYKPASKNLTPSAITVSPSNPMHHHIEPVLPGRPNYYGCGTHSPIIPPQPYHVNPNGNMPPIMGMDHRLPRHYGGSAFTVPHYRHPQHMQFARTEYGYYQPAGPLIQPLHDQCTIHKPVPYHPQPHRLQPPQRPQPQASHLDLYPPHDSHQPHQNSSPIISSNHPPISHPQNSVIPSCPSLLEATTQKPQTSLHYNALQPSEKSQEKCSNSITSSYNRTSKPLPSSSLHSAYSSQNNYRDYQREKEVSNLYGNYPPLPYDQKLSKQSPYDSVSQFHDSNKNKVSSHLPHPVSQESVQSHNVAGDSHLENTHNMSPHSGGNFKHLSDIIHFKEPSWGIKTNHDGISDVPVSFLPFQNEPNKEMPSNDIQETVRYPLRPPSVIEIVEDNCRDTKTYIQLEVPKNSHREKIVVVDVENDDIERKCDEIRIGDKPVLDSNSSQENIISPEKKGDSVKLEVKPTEESTIVKNVNSLPSKNEEPVKELPDIMVLEVKKRKESAVVRRARLHGKQRTFRDCYNRPLAQLSKTKKSDTLIASEEHLNKHLQPLVSLPRLILPKIIEKKPSHGWSWEGTPVDKQIYISNDDPPCIRKCYPSIRHVEGDVICERDCVLLRSGPRKTDVPFVAKVTALWNNPTDGEMTMSLLWYYRPEHTETEKKIHHMEDEIFASKHRDVNSVACIEDKCYVLTYLEYCRYRRKCKLAEDNTITPISVVPDGEEYPRKKKLPPINVSPDLVLFCRKVYDYRQKRLLKNPIF